MSHSRRASKPRPKCPECKHSLNYLTWNPSRQLWEHGMCGFTATQEEVADLK